MAYVRLSDLRTDLVPGESPDEMDRLADRMEAAAKRLRLRALSNAPGAPSFAAQATGLEEKARRLRQAAGTKRAFDGGMADMSPSGPQPQESLVTWPVVLGVAGVFGLGCGFAFGRHGK